MTEERRVERYVTNSSRPRPESLQLFYHSRITPLLEQGFELCDVRYLLPDDGRGCCLDVILTLSHGGEPLALEF